MHFLFSCFCGAISVALGLLRDPTHDVFHVNWAVPWLGPDRYVADISNFSGKIIAKTTALLSLFHKNLGLHIPASWMTENEKWNHLTERSKFLRVPAEEINQCKIICVQKYACSELLMLYFRLCGRFFKASDCDQFEIIIAKICK